MSEPIPTNPLGQKRFIEDTLKRKGLHVAEREPSPQEKIFNSAMTQYDRIWRNSVIPLLKALREAKQYNTAGTQVLIMDMFKTSFNHWTKDELVFLLSAMHAEEMEKQARQIVEQGLIGDNFGNKKLL